MTRRITATLGGLLLLAATGAAAQENITGTVQHYDRLSNTIHLTDGRVVKLEPGATMRVNGQVVSADALRPGVNVVIRGADSPGTHVTPRAQAPGVVTPAPVLATHPPVDATGVVASVDAGNGIVTFQDGRMFKLDSGSLVYETSARPAIRAGDSVMIKNARPVGYRSAWTGAGTHEVMGTVARVEPGGTHVWLSDGRMVRLSPQTRMQLGDQAVVFSELRPGDQIVVRTVPGATVVQRQPGVASSTTTVVTPSDAGSASPRLEGGTATIDASEIVIMRRPQSP
jgi:hypothetical protein